MNGFPVDLLETIRPLLEEEKRRVVSRIDELTAQDPFTDPGRLTDNAASDAEASEESNHDRVAAMIEELGAKRDDIDRALVRIGEGTYGFCSRCGVMIDTDRLSILPMATLCLACEKKKKK